ncbi:MAG TPA: hypothetical protein VK097_03955 [Lentibacillus sp.]|uniref:hypothetical protein n=1 Tax=Lentibacillus sp. TaxID=1925746 RepID=UPI002B4AED3A|nr:hypothetical protein [Lentibacillus sp.]HLR61578.1 hypothetical protein [Lentibacillus sp.]
MDKKKRKPHRNDETVAPGMDPDDSFGEEASETEIKKNRAKCGPVLFFLTSLEDVR